MSNLDRRKPIRCGMVGVGGFGKYRRERMRETGLFELIAAYDVNPAALREAAQQAGAKPVDSYAALLATPDLEAIIISTGAKSHTEQALAAMEQGLHVFVEKPLCATASELQALVSRQRATGVVVGVGHTDHSPDARSRTIRQLIDRGDFGAIGAFEKGVPDFPISSKFLRINLPKVHRSPPESAGVRFSSQQIGSRFA